jgi:hypothetical protein
MCSVTLRRNKAQKKHKIQLKKVIKSIKDIQKNHHKKSIKKRKKSRVDWLYTVRELNTKKAKNQTKKPSGFFGAILFLSSYYMELLWLDHLRQILLQAFTIDKISRSAY